MIELISRQAAIKAIDDLPNCYNGYSDTYDKSCIIGVLEELPSVEPKKGKWIWDDEGYHCSECFYHAYGETGSILSNEWHYCPNCGALMERSADASR